MRLFRIKIIDAMECEYMSAQVYACEEAAEALKAWIEQEKPTFDAFDKIEVIAISD